MLPGVRLFTRRASPLAFWESLTPRYPVVGRMDGGLVDICVLGWSRPWLGMVSGPMRRTGRAAGIRCIGRQAHGAHHGGCYFLYTALTSAFCPSRHVLDNTGKPGLVPNVPMRAGTSVSHSGFVSASCGGTVPRSLSRPEQGRDGGGASTWDPNPNVDITTRRPVLFSITPMFRNAIPRAFEPSSNPGPTKECPPSRVSTISPKY